MGAYTLVLEEGLDDRRPDAASWFAAALDLSGPEGPIRRFELRDIPSRQTDWNEHVCQVNEGISRGEVPLVVAAPALHTTLADLIQPRLGFALAGMAQGIELA